MKATVGISAWFGIATFVAHSSAAPPLDGKAVWLRTCAVCHGADGRGKTEWAKRVVPPPKDLTDPTNVTWVFREDWLRMRILAGVPGTAMPGWEGVLSSGEVDAVTAFVRRLSGADRMTQAQALRHQTDRGRRIYRQRCAACHGVAGKAGTQIAKAVRPPPTDLTDASLSARLDLPAIEAAVREGKPGTVMPAWGKVLDEQEIRAVSVYVRRGIQRKAD